MVIYTEKPLKCKKVSIILSFCAQIFYLLTSDAPEPRLGSARIWLELLVKKLGSARPIFQKARIRKFFLTRAFLGLLKKIIGIALF